MSAQAPPVKRKETFTFTRQEAEILLDALRIGLQEADRNREFRRPGEAPFRPGEDDLQALTMYLKLNRALEEPHGDLFLPPWADDELVAAYLRSQEPAKQVPKAKPRRRKTAKATSGIRQVPLDEAQAAQHRREVARSGGLARAKKAAEAKALATQPPGPSAPPVPAVEQVG